MRRTTELALGAVYAALYVSLVAVFPFLSFLQLNVRVANVLKGMVKFWPVGVLLGNFVAVIVSNFVFSPLGFLDVAWSPVASTVFLGVAYVIGKRSFFVGLVVNAALLGVYLAWLLSTVLGLSFLGLLPFLLAGTAISDVILPYTLYKALLRLGVPRRMGAA